MLDSLDDRDMSALPTDLKERRGGSFEKRDGEWVRVQGDPNPIGVPTNPVTGEPYGSEDDGAGDRLADLLDQLVAALRDILGGG